MEDEFEALFNEILSNNDFSELEEKEMSVQEIAEAIESINVASAILSQSLTDALDDEEHEPYEFPDDAVPILRSLKVLADHLGILLADDCTCDVEDEEEDDDDE